MKDILLESSNLKLLFDRETGVLKGMTAVQTGWEIIKRPELGLSFRLLVPLADRRNNPVFGEKQQLSSYKYDSEEQRVIFTWESVVSEYGGELPIKVVETVSLQEDNFVFEVEIKNDSPYIVENVYCPYFGELRHPEDTQEFKSLVVGVCHGRETPIWPTYQNDRGYFGFDYPEQYLSTSPASPFCLLKGEKQGLYVGGYTDSTDLFTYHTCLMPGYDCSLDTTVPEGEQIGGKDIAVRFSTVHLPYVLSGETRSMPPIAIQAYRGTWHKGVDIYKKWRSTRMRDAEAPDWVKEPHSWQQIHINSPEDELRVRYTDLVKVGEECARHGVKAIQLVGWSRGGQDRDDPTNDIDPRLGTFEELKQAIKDIQALGVKVVLFVKFTWGDRSSKWFREELQKHAVKDPYGDYYLHKGYQYNTVTQGLDVNVRRLIPMCFNDPEYVDICCKEFQKILDLGADGFLYDECEWHGPGYLCFDESHGHRYGMPVFGNDCGLISRFEEMLPENSDFLFSGEACYDWQIQKYHLSYSRSWNPKLIPLTRYIHPFFPVMTGVPAFNDRNIINQCLMYKFIISYEPYHFKGRLEDFPDTLEYGKKMDALRTELRDYLWDGEFRDSCGAEVLTDAGAPHHPYSVFINQENSKKCLVICNYNANKNIRVSPRLKDGGSLHTYRIVGEEEWHDFADFIEIPVRSAVVVL